MALAASFLLEDFRASVRVASQKSIPSIGAVPSSPHKDANQDEQGRQASDNPRYEVAPKSHVPPR
jgi:hypothetical protein